MSKIKKGQFRYFTSFPSKIFGTFLVRLRKSPEQPLNWDALPKLLSIRETAKVLNVHPNTLRLWDQRGTLRAVRIGVRHDRRYKRETVRAQWLLTQISPSERLTTRWTARQELIHRLQRAGFRPWTIVTSLVIVTVLVSNLGHALADQSTLVSTNLQPQECTGWMNAQQAQSINAPAQGESFTFSKNNSAQYLSNAFQVHSVAEGVVSGSVDTPNDIITCHGFSVRRIPTGANVTDAKLAISFQARSESASSSSFSLETSLDGLAWTALKVLPATADVPNRMVIDLPSMSRDQLAKLRVRILPDVEIDSPAVTAWLDGIEIQTTAATAPDVAPTGTPKAKQALDRLVAFSKSVYSAEETPIMTVPKRKVTKVLFVPTKRVDWTVNRVTLVDQNGNESEAAYTSRDIPQGESVNTSLALQTINIHPGRYRLNVTMTSSEGGVATSSKDFLWGVVAVNFDRATPRPGEPVQVAIAVLDDAGRTICDANVEAKLTDPHGKTSTYNTDRKSIARNSNCIDKGVTNSPDYQLRFTPADAGTYHFTLKAKTAVGDRTYEENLLVGTSEKFDVQRSAEPTRIYPPSPYTVTIGVTPLQDFVGVVTERVPANFLITTLLPEGSIVVAASPTDHQLLEWSVDWKKGQTYLLHYTFDAPDISPALFTSGPLTIASTTLSGYDYLEPRAWQIASDTLIKKTKENIKFKALDDVVGDWDATQPVLISTARPIYTSDEQVTVKLWTKGFSLTSDPGNPVTIKNIEVTSSGGPSAGFDEADDLVKKNGRERTIVYLVPNEHFRPGIYTVNYVVSDRNGDRAVSFPIQWGTVDTIVAAGKQFAGDQLDLQLASVDTNGATDCTSSLELTVTAPDGKQTTSSTIDGTIKPPVSCQQQAAHPEGNYVLRTIPELVGTYHVKLTRTAGDQVFFTERNITLSGRDATPENVRQDIEGAVRGPKKLYRPSEKPTVEVDTQTSGLLGLNKKTREITAVKLIDPSTKTEVVDPTLTEVTDGGKTTSSFTFDPTVMHRPGKYTMVMTVVQDGFAQQISQDFTWGVLDVNVRRSFSHSNTAIEVGMSVLDDGGHTQCSADVQLDVTDPAGKVQHFATTDNTILIDPDCVDRGVTIKPDYAAQYTTGGPGQYTTTVTATIANGTRTITDTFQVDDTVPFDVERTTFPTRIYPHPTYPVNFTITAKADYAGAVTETVTSMFDITDISDAGVQTTPDPATKVLTWSVDWKAGETHTLGYTIAFPDRAPDFYVIGPLQIGTFKEARQWQIASDASACTLSYSAAANWTTAAWANCASSYPGATVSGDTASITNVTTGATLTLNTSITTNALGSLTINANAVASTLALGANTLTVNGTVTVTQPSAAVTTTLSMTSGSLIIQNSNNLAMSGTTTTASTIATVTVTTGLLDVGGSIVYDNTASMPAANKVVSLKSTGRIYVRGAQTLRCGTLRNQTTAGTLQFDGLLTIGSATCASASTFSTIASSTVKIGSGISTVASSTPTVTFNASSVANFTASGTITPSAGTLTLGRILIDSGAVVTLAGNVTTSGTGTTAFVNNNDTNSWTGTFTTTFSGATPTVVGDTTFSTLTTTGATTNFTVGANTTVTVTNNYSDAQGAGATKLDLDTNSGAALTIGGTMTIRNSSGASTNTYKVGKGTLTVTGEIIWTGTSATTSRIGSLTLTTGTINANGGIDTTGTPATCNGCNNINISGGAGTFNLKGHVQANNVNEGASGWVFTNTTCTNGGGTFVYADTSATQTVYFPSSGGYCNLQILTTTSTGATLNGNITTSNLKGNLTVGESGGTVAAILNLNNKTVTGNVGGTMFLYDTATVVQIGAAGGSFPSGFGTLTFTSNSNYNFNTSGTTTAIGAITYGNVNFIPSTTVTFTLPAGTVTVGGTLTIGNGTNTTLLRDQINGTTLTVNGDFTMVNNSQFTADTTNAVTVGGSLSVAATNTTFTHNNGTFIFTSTASGKTIDTDSESFYNVIFNGSGGTWKPVTNNMTIANDLTMTAGTLEGNGALNVTVNGNIACGASCGTIDMTANSGSGTFTQNVAAAEGFGTSVTADTTAWTFYDLTFSSSAGTNTVTTSATPTAPGAVNVTNVLTIGANTTLDAGTNSRDWILSKTGTPLTNSGTLTGNASEFIYTGTTTATTVTAVANTNYGNLSIKPTAATTYTIGSAAGQTLNVTGDLVVGDGTGGHTPTIDCVGTAYNPNIAVDGNITLNNPSVWTKGSGTLTMDNVAGSVNLADNNSTKQDLGALVIGDGATAKSVTMTTNITVSSINITTAATLVAPSGTLKVSGNWTNSGTFTHNSGTVELNGTAQQAVSGTVSGATGKFNNLTVTNAFGDGSSTFSATFAGDAETAATFTATTANTKLRFNATSTYTFQDMTLNGQATGTRVYLRSSTGASAWLLNVAGTATVSYTNVMDSNATGSASAIDASNGTNVNATGNTNWNFSASISVSGTIYQSGTEGSVFDCSGANNISLHVSVNGGTNANGTCSAVGGTFTITGVTAPSGADIPVAIFSDSASSNKLTTVTLSSGTGNITGLTLIIGRVVVSQESATAITNAYLSTADNSDAGIRYAVSGGNLTVESGLELHVLTGKTFTPGGTVTTTATGTAAGPAGDIHIPASAVMDVGSNALSVGGDFTNAGTFTKTSGQTTTLTATGTGFTVTAGGTTFQNIVFNGASGNWTNSGALAVAGTWTGTAGGFTQANSTTITVTGTSFSLANGFTWTKASSGANLILDNVTNLSFADNNGTKQNLGVVQIGASPGTTTLTTDLSADSVTIPTGDTFNTKGYDVTTTGSLDCQGTCVLDLSDSGGSNEGDGTVMTIGGDWTTSSTSTFTADTSTVIMNGTGSKTITQGGGAFNNLQTNNSGTYTVGGGITDDFERGSLGGNWTSRQGTSTISGSSDYGGSATGDNLAAYTGATFSGDQYAEATISALSAGNETQICVRVNASGPLAYYCLTSDGTLLDINEYYNGAWAGQVASGSVYPAVGDRLRLEAQGTTLRAYINGRLYITGTDASTSTGYPGLNVWASGTPTSTLEDFTAGNLLHSLSDITVSQGTLATGANSVQVDGGDISVSGTYSQSSNGVTSVFSTGSVGGSGTTTFGGLIVGNTGTTQTTTAGGNFSANGLMVPQSSGTNTFDASSRTITISGSGTLERRPFIIDATEVLTEGSSTFVFTGTSNVDIYPESFVNLTIAPNGAGSPTYTFDPQELGDPTNITGNLIVGDSTNTVTLNMGAFTTVTVTGDVTVSTNATLITSSDNADLFGGSFTNNGSWDGGGNVSFNATSTGKTLSGNLTGANKIYANFDGVGGGWTINSNADFYSLNIIHGAITQGANVNITIEAGISFSSGTTFTKASGSGTVTFVGTTAQSVTDNTASKQNLGKVTITKTNGVPSNNKITLASSILVDTLTVSASNTLDLANAGYILTVANAGATANPLTVTGTLTPNSSSTVSFTATNSGGNINIPTNSYASLDLSPGSAETYDVAGDVTVSDALTVGTNATLAIASTKTVTLSKNTGTSLTLNGVVNGAGRLSYQNSATTFPTSGTISSIVRIDTLNGNMAIPARTFGGDLEIQNTSGVGRTVNLGTGASQTITIGGSFTWATSGGAGSTLVVDGSVTNTTNPSMAITGSVAVSGSPTGAITLTMGVGGWTVGGSFDLTNVTTLNAGNILTMNGTGTLTTNGLTLVGFTTTGSGTITLANATHTFSGSIALGSSATIVPGTSTVVMNTGGTTIQGGGQSLYAFTVNPASATVTLGGSNLTVTNQLTVAATTTLSINSGYTLTNSFSTNASISGTLTSSGTGKLIFPSGAGGPGTTGTLTARVRYDATAGDIASTTVDARSYRGGVELYSSSGSNRVITYPTGSFTCTGSALGLYLYADGAGNLTVDMTTNNPSSVATCGGIDFLGSGGGTEILNQGTGSVNANNGNVDFTGGTYTSNGTLLMSATAGAQTLTTAGNTLKNLTVTTSDFTFANETVTISGNLNLSSIGNTLTPGTSTVVMTGTSNSLTMAGYELYNLTIDPATAGTITTDQLSVSHNLTVATGDTLSIGAGYGVVISTTTATVTLNGTISGGGEFWYESANAFPTTGTINTAVWFVSDSATDLIASARTYGGDVVIDHGSGSNFKTTFGTAGGQTLDISGNLILGVDGLGNNTIDASAWNPTVNVTGSVVKRTDTGSGVRSILSGTGTWTVGGDINLTGISFTAASGNTLKMNGTTKTLTSAGNTIHHFEIAGGSTTMADTATLAGNMTITSGTLTAPATLNVQGNWSNAGGTFTEGTGTVNFTGAASMTLDSGCANTDTCTNENFYNLTLNKTDASDANDNVTLTTNGIRVTNTITVTDGELVQGALNVRVEGATAVSIASGSDKKWTNISTGDLKLGGTFTSGGTVVFNSNNGTQCVDAADDIVITSTVGGTQRLWTNTGTMAIYNVNATDMTNSSITAYTSTLSNTTWTVGSCGITVSGVIRQSSDETTAYDCSANTLTIGVTVNGGTSATADCTLNTGAYSIVTATSPSAAGDPIVVYINSGETPIGTTVTLSVDTSSNVTNLDIIDGRVVLTHENAGPMTNAKMATGDNGNAGIRYSVATGNLTTESGIELHVKASKTYTAGGTVSTNATGGDLHVLGTATIDTGSNSIGRDISVATGATLNINASTTVEGGDILTAGTGIIAKSGTPTVLVHGTGNIGGGSGAIAFYNLTIGDGTTASSTLNTSMTVSHAMVIGASSQLSISSSKVATLSSLTGTSFTLNGTVSGAGTLSYSNTATVFPTSGTVNSRVQFNTSLLDITIPARTYGSDVDCYDLAGGTCVLGAGTINISGNLATVDNGDGNILTGTSNNPTVNLTGNFVATDAGTGVTISMGSGTWTIGGTVDLSQVTAFNHNSGTVIMNGTSKTLISAGKTFYNLTLSGSITLDDALGDHYVAGDLSLSGTITPQSSVVRMTGISKNLTGGGNSLATLYIDPSTTGTITLTGSDVNISTALTVGSGDTLSLGASRNLTLGVGATVATTGTISGSGKLIYQNTSVAFPAALTISSALRMDATNGAQTIGGTNSATRTFGGAVEIFSDNNLISRTVTLEDGTARTFAFGGGLTLTANNSQAVTLTADTTTDPTVTVTGNLAFTSAGTAETLVSGSGTWSVSGNVDFSGGTYTATSGNTLTMTGTGTLTTNGNSLYNFATSGAGTVTFANATHTITGDMTLVSGKTITPGTSTIAMTGAGKNLSGGGKDLYNLTIGANAVTVTENVGVSNTLTVATGNVLTIAAAKYVVVYGAGSVSLTGTINGTGTLLYLSNASFPAGGTISSDLQYSPVGGSVTITSRTYDGNVSCLDDGSLGVTCYLTGAPVFNGNLTVDDAGVGVILDASTNNPNPVTIAKNFTTSYNGGGVSLYMGTGTWNVSGDFDLSNVAVLTSTGTLVMDGNNGTGTFTGGPTMYNTSFLPASGKTVTISSGVTHTLLGDLVLGGTGTLTTTGSTVVMSGAGKTITGGGKTLNNLTISGNTTVQTSNLTVAGALVMSASKTLTITGVTLTDSGTTDISWGASSVITGTGLLTFTSASTGGPGTGGTLSVKVRFDASGGSIPSAVFDARTYGSDLDLYSNATGAKTVTFAATTYDIAGNLTVIAGASQTVSFGVTGTASNPAVNLAGDLAYSKLGTVTPSITSGSGLWTVSGNANFTGGSYTGSTNNEFKMNGAGKTLTAGSFYKFTSDGTITQSGVSQASNVLKVNSGKTLTVNGTFMSQTSGTITMTGGTIDGSGAIYYINSTGFPSDGTLNVADVYFQPFSGSVTIPGRTFGGNVICSDNNIVGSTCSLTGTLIINGSLTADELGTAVAVIGAPTAVTIGGNVVANTSGGTRTLDMNGTWTVSGNFDITSFSTFSANSSSLIMDGAAGSVTLSSGANELHNLTLQPASGKTITVSNGGTYLRVNNNLVLGGVGSLVTTGETILMINGTTATLDGGNKTIYGLAINKDTTLQTNGVTVSNLLTINGAILTITGVSLTNTYGTDVNWSGGTITGTGTLIFPNGAGGPGTAGTLSVKVRYDSTNGDIGTGTIDGRTYGNTVELYNNSATSRTVTMPATAFTTSGSTSNWNLRADGSGDLTMVADTNNPAMTIGGDLDFTGTGNGTEVIAAGTGTWTVSGNVNLTDGIYGPSVAALSATYSETANRARSISDICAISTTYNCGGGGTYEFTDTSDCVNSGTPGDEIIGRAANMFDLSSLSGTILAAQLGVILGAPAGDEATIGKGTTDTVNSLSCTTSAMWNTLGSSTYGTTIGWTSGGGKLHDLGATGVADVQSRAGSATKLTVVIRMASLNPPQATYTTPAKLYVGYYSSGSPTLVMNGSSKTLTTAGNVLYNATLSGSITLANATHSIANDLNMSGGTITPGTSTVTMTGTAGTLTGPTSGSLNNLTIDPATAGTVTLAAGGGDLTVSGVVTVATGDTLSLGSARTLTASATSGSSVVLNGTVSGSGRLTYMSSTAFPTAGTISSILRFDTTGATSQIISSRTYDGAVEIYNNSGGAKTVASNAGTMAFNSALDLSVGSGTVTLDLNTTDPTTTTVSGNVTIGSGATLSAPSSNAFNVNANYTNNGTFTHNSGTTTLAGAAQQTLTGTMTGATGKFNNLVITNVSGSDPDASPSVIFASSAETAATLTAATANVKLRFSSSGTYTFNAINFSGAAGNLVTLRSSTPGTATTFVVGAGSRTVTYASIQDNNACGSSGGEIDASDGTNVDKGNASCWLIGKLTVVLSGTTVNLTGVNPLTTSFVNFQGVTSTVTTNAPNGYVSTVSYAGAMTNGTDTIADAGGSATAGTSGFGASTSKASQSLAQSNTSPSCSTTQQQGAGPYNATTLTTSGAQYAAAAGSATNDATTLCFLGAISGSQAPGQYSSTVTLVTTARF